MWHFWANDINNMAKKLKLKSLKCPMCNHEGLSLDDVNLESEIKIYGNTFLSWK